MLAVLRAQDEVRRCEKKTRKHGTTANYRELKAAKVALTEAIRADDIANGRAPREVFKHSTSLLDSRGRLGGFNMPERV